jgi:hypothetical protein
MLIRIFDLILSVLKLDILKGCHIFRELNLTRPSAWTQKHNNIACYLVSKLGI